MDFFSEKFINYVRNSLKYFFLNPKYNQIVIKIALQKSIRSLSKQKSEPNN